MTHLALPRGPRRLAAAALCALALPSLAAAQQRDSVVHAPNGGDLVRATLGFEQIGASGVDGSQKFDFSVFISRPLPVGPADATFGPRLRWWGDVGMASYPQQVSTDVASFATGFTTAVAKLKVAQLVQTADFTTGFEIRLASLDGLFRGFAESTPERFALSAYGSYGAVGPFPLAADAPPVFIVPDSATPQGRAFAAANGPVASKYVAFRVNVPDRFRETLSAGLRLYTYYADSAGRLLEAVPAMVSIGYGRNDLVSARGHYAWHASANYPLAFGNRADPGTIVVYLFGDAWLNSGPARLYAPAYQLQPATVDGTTGGAPVSASDPEVTILTVDPQPRDTYRLGVSVDLLKIWSHVVGGGTGK